MNRLAILSHWHVHWPTMSRILKDKPSLTWARIFYSLIYNNNESETSWIDLEHTTHFWHPLYEKEEIKNRFISPKYYVIDLELSIDNMALHYSNAKSLQNESFFLWLPHQEPLLRNLMFVQFGLDSLSQEVGPTIFLFDVDSFLWEDYPLNLVYI